MRSRCLVVVLSLLLLSVVGVPSAAAEPGDNGNGFRVVSHAEYTSLVWWNYPVCNGEQVDWVGPVQASWTLSDTSWEKNDETAEKWLMEGFLVLGDYRQDHWERRITASIDPSTGIPSVLHYMGKVSWSDSEGVYATQDMEVLRTWNADGEVMFERNIYTGVECVRDTVVTP